MRSTLVLSTLFTIAVSQSSTLQSATSTNVEPINPTPDALDLDGIRAIPDPTYTVVEGLLDFDVPYETETAIASVALAVAETPLSVFPAVSTVAINADGEADSMPTAPAKRDVVDPLKKRAACATQATIPNSYNVNVGSYQSFKADPIIASVANAAPTPQGYFQNFKNLPSANSAYAYLGYSVVKTYDVQACANKCSSKAGCLAFNIYFERDPILEPGTGCENPDAFANIKCSFWGSALDSKTATNAGQWRSKFQVAVAGSNAYTSYQIGGPIDGWSAPLSLDNAAMNAPLRDCADTWTYLGYKLFTSGPFDPQLCSVACDAQTTYNLDNPPKKGDFPARCAAFGTYLLTKTNSSGSYPQGQMCTLYTSAWGAEYAVNKAQYDDAIGAKYTFSYSFYYSKPEQQPVCPSDVNYLKNYGEFCTSFLDYTPSTSVVYTISTPAVSSVVITSTNTVYPTDTTTATSTSIVIQYYKRAAETPASISNWPAPRISEGCAKVATGVKTSTSVFGASVPFTTVYTTVSTTASAVTVTTTVGTVQTSLQPSPTPLCSDVKCPSTASVCTADSGALYQIYCGQSSNTGTESLAQSGDWSGTQLPSPLWPHCMAVCERMAGCTGTHWYIDNTEGTIVECDVHYGAVQLSSKPGTHLFFQRLGR